MVELDGKEYSVKSPAENALDIVTFINNYCANHDIRNSKNELIQISALPTNPLYMIIWGLGVLVSVIQNLIYSLGCSFSIANSSESQLLNLGDIAGMKRIQASRTTIDLLVYSSTSQSCHIPITASMSYGGATFLPAFPVDIPANSAARVIMIAQSDGAYNISANTLTTFDTPIENVRSIIQHASVPGRPLESISSYRERLQKRSYSGTMIDRAQDAISELEGVTMCNIYFNPSPTETKAVGSINVTPRTALVLVQGYNLDIAKAFFSNCLCETTDAGVDRTLDQVYTTHANQQLTCHIAAPLQKPCYITVYSNQVLPSSIQQQMKDAILKLSETQIAGQSLTTAAVLNQLVDFRNYGILGATVGESSALQYYQITPAIDELYVFNGNNIVIDMTGAVQ